MTTNKLLMVSRDLLERIIALDPGCNIDGITIYEDCTEELRAILSASTDSNSQDKPVAWQRKWAFDKEKPYKEKNANGRMAWAKKFIFYPVTENKIFPDDVPLYAGKNQ